MIIETSFPGQEVRRQVAPPHIVEHFNTKGWLLPFVKRIFQ